MSGAESPIRNAIEAQLAKGLSASMAARAVATSLGRNPDDRALRNYAREVARSFATNRPASAPPNCALNTGARRRSPTATQFRVECLAGRHFVFKSDGARVYGPADKATAETKCDNLQREFDNRAKIGLRPCMSCKREFHSEGIHNRLCSTCRGVSDPLSGTGFAGSGDGRKPRKAAKV